MAQLRQFHEEFVKRDAVIVVVGPDSAASFKKFWEKQDMPFVGLADPGSKVAEQYEQVVSLWKMGRMPAEMIIDKAGRVRFSHYAENMRDYPTLEDLYGVLDELGKE